MLAKAYYNIFIPTIVVLIIIVVYFTFCFWLKHPWINKVSIKSKNKMKFYEA